MSIPISRNAFYSIIQVVVSGISLFAMYSVVTRELGIDVLGIWALVMAATAVTRIGEFGISAAITQRVASISAVDSDKHVGKTVQSALTVVIPGAALTAVVIWLLGQLLIVPLYDSRELIIAQYFLIFGLLVFFLNAISGVFQGIVEGYQRYDLFSAIHALASIIQALVTILLAAKFGYKVMAWAALFQIIFVLISMILAARLVTGRWQSLIGRPERQEISHLIRFGGSIQGVFLGQLGFELLSKTMLQYYGSTVNVGIFEVASKLLIRARQVFASALQVTMPATAKFHMTNPGVLIHYYQKTAPFFRMVMTIGFLYLLMLTPLLESFFFHETTGFFRWVMLAGCFAWMINAWSLIEFNLTIGEGRPKEAFYSQIIQLGVFIIAAVSFGGLFGESGVLLAWSFSAVAAAFFLVLRYRNTVSIHLQPFLYTRILNSPAILLCIAGIAVTVTDSSTTIVGWAGYAILLFSLSLYVAINIFRNRAEFIGLISGRGQ